MKISEDIHQIDGTMANTYFIENSGEGILIDSGTKGSAGKIIDFIDNGGFNLKTVLITHYHMDHVGGLSRIAGKYRPEIFVPDEEVDVISGKKKPESAKSFLSKMVGAVAHPEPVQGIRPVSEYGSERITVLKTHGHTPGSTSYLLENEKIVFVGDAVVNGKNGLEINRAFTLDMEDAKRSENIIRGCGAGIILSGHGKPYYIKVED